MNRNRQKWKIAVLTLLFALLIVFIFSNSLKSSEESNGDSAKLASVLEPLIEMIFGEGRVSANYVVRKCAHLAEFALLGFLSMLLVRATTRYNGKKLLSVGLFVTLAVAVADEYIQTFTGRTSSVSDVLIDFSGVLIGMTVAFLLCLIKRKDRK